MADFAEDIDAWKSILFSNIMKDWNSFVCIEYI